MAGGPAVAAMPARGGPLGGTVGRSASANASLMATLRPEERHELEQYEKILRFRDEVVSGTHPRIKPTHVGKPTPGPGPVPPANASAASAGQAPGGAKPAVNGNRAMTDNFQAYQANLKKPAVNLGGHVPGLGTLSNTSSEQSKPKVEINPILLEKSDDLIKAEIQLQRQRIERSLREDVEQRRVSQKGALQPSEQPADFDIANVLAKALVLVQANAAQTTDDTVANASASGDSFDDNTFYSSQHGTPDSHHQLARVPTESEDEQMRDGSPYEPELDLEPVAVPAEQPKPALPSAPAAPTNLPIANAQQQQVHSASSSATSVPQPFNVNVPGTSSAATSVSRAARQFPPSEAVSSRDSGPASRSEESTHTGKERGGGSRDLSRVNEQLLRQALGPEGSPVVRAHNLSPFAPQPSRVSPLPTAALEQPIALSETGGRRATPAPAQGVAALRKQPSAVSSPESSPHGGERPGDRKKNKKKKRKADRLAEAAAASPYIKPEPRSPSPMSAPQYTRPTKRQKQGHPQHPPPDYDDARYGQPGSVEGAYQERLQPRVQREERVVGYEREIDPRPRLEGEPLLATPRYERVYYDDPRAPLSGGRLPGSPGVHPSPYAPREVRAAPRNVIYDVPPADDGYYRDVRAASRMSMRPAAYRERSSRSPVAYERVAQPMAPPPRVPATRIVVDAFGREYIEPPRPQSVVAERPEIVYARPPPPRAVTRRPEGYDDEVMVYEPTSPGYVPQRRVIAQPEYVTPEHRVYRERAYSTHPMGPPSGDYVPSRLRVEGRPVVEMPQEYIARPGSVRPPMEPTRYESVAAYDLRAVDERPREYYGGRAASVRPVAEAVRYEAPPPLGYERRMGAEPSLREYTTIRSASVRPPLDAARYEIRGDYGARLGSVQPEMAGREYQGRPEMRREVMQPPPPPVGGRAYSVFPPEQPPTQVMRGDGGAYGDERYYARPPPVQQEDDEVVYLDRPPMRDAYRQYMMRKEPKGAD
ncbi:hypothetical protein B0H65DRAFT_320409 [Neurospora tetraspora]|uniref:Uncharacterized protein n=1 Tax=Neurospora tetraspora TaxID=94610 RepID=A0AAE0J7H1_9PEZI|nr:hypothetical protein B0H65DRAFT_320409 [Neurospora tetraspora]